MADSRKCVKIQTGLTKAGKCVAENFVDTMKFEIKSLVDRGRRGKNYRRLMKA